MSRASSLSLATLLQVSCLCALSAQQPQAPGWVVVGWNDLGMHCMDADFSVFSLLPPYNTIHAHVITPSGKLVRSTTGIRLTYEGVADPGGSTNRSSAGKTDFWRHAPALYGGSSQPDRGLAGFDMPGSANTPQAMVFDPAANLFHADGIPITPIDDAGHRRPYPMMQIVARDGQGSFLGATGIVLPVSDEMDCSVCHASGTVAQARPAAGWAYGPHAFQDTRLNILLKHDDDHLGKPAYQAALTAAGYSSAGLADTVRRLGTPILCARCHASNALPGTGLPYVSPLTQAMHAGHALVRDPVTGQTLDAETNRSACYRCHPGTETRCLRGAMGGAVAPGGELAMQCQNCHGSMSLVGRAGRVGWLDQPACQNCHTGTAVENGGQIRFTDAYDAPGHLRVPRNPLFATNADVPAPGFSLYRFSSGHGGLRCESCHGSTHAEYPSTHRNDNLQSVAIQGHAGTLAECTACHTSVVGVVDRGPHGLHPLNQEWLDRHGDVAERQGSATCAPCHGLDYRGSVLSRTHNARTFQTPWGQRQFPAGATIGCWTCHLGPDQDDPNPNRAPVARDATLVVADIPVGIDLPATDADANPLTFRIVTQPAAGRVALAGRRATYHPDPGFAGTDRFTFLAWDGSIDSQLGTVLVTRTAGWSNYGVGYPGTAGAVPAFVASAPPALGSVITLRVGNTFGQPTLFLLVLSPERTWLPTIAGGLLWTEPTAIVLLSLPGGGADLVWSIPDDPLFVGFALRMQAVAADPGSLFGLAFSRALELVLGR